MTTSTEKVADVCGFVLCGQILVSTVVRIIYDLALRVRISEVHLKKAVEAHNERSKSPSRRSEASCGFKKV